MRTIKSLSILFICLLFSLSNFGQDKPEIIKSTEIQNVNGKDFYIHIVQKGHTVYSISKVYEIPIEEIYFHNPEARNGLNIDQVLHLPIESRDKEINQKLNTNNFEYLMHIVQRGETLYGISKKYEIDLEIIIDLNPEAEKGLKVGQYLKIPALVREMNPDPPGTPDKLIEHIVEAGETLYRLSKAYGVSIADIKKYNPGMNQPIKVGEIIYFPYSSKEVLVKKDTIQYHWYKVQPNENIYKIALRKRISVDSLLLVNTGLSDELNIGQRIKIPKTNLNKTYITHIVQNRTKLKKIAKLYGLGSKALNDLNPGKTKKLQRGEVVNIPLPKYIPGKVVIEKEIEPGLKRIPDKLLRMVDIDSVRCNQQYYHTDEVFKIALMLPLYLEDADSLFIQDFKQIEIKAEHKPFNFLQFYEGFKIAVDSLKSLGLRLEVFVYDVDNQVSKTIQVLQKRELSEMDLIIGPLFRKNFKLVSNFAKMFDIKIINPLSRRDEILEHENVIKIKPDPEAQLKIVESIIKEENPEAKILLIRHNNYKYGEELSRLKMNLEMDLADRITIANTMLDGIIKEYSAADTTLSEGELIESLNVEDIIVYREFVENALEDSTSFANRVDEIIYTNEGIDGLLRKASIIRQNYIVAFSDNKAFAFELMTKLNELKDSINVVVIGLPEWDRFSDMETDHLHNLNIHFLADSYINYKDAAVKNFVRKYRNEYKTEPDRYAFDGYDIGFYFLSALLHYGKSFERCLPYYNEKLLQTSYEFKKSHPVGLENQYWNPFIYRNYKKILLK
ncbi:LysM peptidoglycan-binding domain-containing protein [Bacteroidota bacterium]